MFKRYFRLMEEAGGEGATGGAPAPAAEAVPAPAAPAADTGLTPLASLVNDNVVDPPADAAAKPEGEAKPEAVVKEPISYTDFTLPEGVTLQDEALDGFKTLASESGIPQEAAQKMLDMYVKDVKAIQEAPMRASAIVPVSLAASRSAILTLVTAPSAILAVVIEPSARVAASDFVTKVIASVPTTGLSEPV